MTKPKYLSFFRLPILWLYLGPPAIREITLGRNALSSLDGDQDIWNIIRVAFWAFWGLIVIFDLLRNGTAVRDMMRRIGALPVVVMVWSLSLIFSAIISPAPSYTFASGSMFLILSLAALDLAVKVFSNQTSVREVLKYLVAASVLLLTAIWITFTYFPHINVYFMSFQGPRIRGGDFGYTPIMALVLIFAGSYLAYTSKSKLRYFLWLLPVYGLFWLGLGQTRSSYVAFLMGLVILFFHLYSRRMDAVKLTAIFITVLIGFGAIGMMYGMSDRVTRKIDGLYDRYVLRDQYAVEDPDYAASSLLTLNGRTEAQRILVLRIIGEPFGLGFKAGPRNYMAGVEGLSEAFLGPHNAFLDIWAGSGYIGLITWVIIVFVVLIASRRQKSLHFCIIRILLYTLLLEGMLESDLSSPFKQSSALFWILAACIIGIEASSRRMAEHHRNTRNRELLVPV